MSSDIAEMHWQHDLLGSIEVGLAVLDRDYNVLVWNQFMENHSGILPTTIRDKCLFDYFPEIEKDWFIQKSDPVFDLRSPAFIIWEQRPYLFKFPNYRPITGGEDYMYQNITLAPLVSATGAVDHISMMIYDVTDIAANKKHGEALEVTLNELREKLAKQD